MSWTSPRLRKRCQERERVCIVTEMQRLGIRKFNMQSDYMQTHDYMQTQEQRPKKPKKTVRSKLMQYVLYRQQQQQQQQQKQQQQQRQRSTATTAQLRAAYRAATQPRKVDILYFSPSLNTVRTGTFRRQTPGKRTCDVAIYPLVQTVDILPHLSLGVVDAVAVFPPRDPLGVGGLCRCVG